MKKLQVLLLGAALAGTHPVHALINDGKFGDSGELFISVYDEAGQKSYYKDLGVTMAQFLNGQGCFAGDLAADPNFAAFRGKSGLVYNIAAVNPLAKDSGNLATWGYLATSSQGASIFPTTFNLIDNAKQKIQGYIGALNVDPFEGRPEQIAEHRSGVFASGDLAYHGRGTWGPSMGQSVKGNTEGQVDRELEFYFVNNPTGADNAGKATRYGAWTLSSAGQLAYAGTGTTAQCAGTATNRAPTAVVASPTLSVEVNTLATLDGSGSSDPDNGPQPLSFAWKQTSGPSAALANATQAKASFTPAQAGTYVFELTVSDGKDSATAQATVTARTALPTGPYIRISAPAAWKARQRKTIGWTTQQVDAGMPVSIQFSKNGGAKYRTIKSLANRRKAFVWRPVKSHVTQQGVLRLCVKPTRKIKTPVCDQLNITVQP